MLSHLGLWEMWEKTEGVLVDRRWRGRIPLVSLGMGVEETYWGLLLVQGGGLG